MSSPIAFDDTQFDLDLSDHLEQFADGPAPEPASDAPAFADVVPVGDPWGVPTDTPASVSAAEAEVDGSESEAAVAAPVVAPEPVAEVRAEWEPTDEPAPRVAAVTPIDPPAFAATTVEDVPVPWVPADGGTAAYAAAVAPAVDPPTSVHSVFAVTPPQGMPVVVPPPVPPVPAARVAVGKAPRAARHRRRGVAVLAAVLAAGLVAGGAGLAIATTDGGGSDGGGDVAVAGGPGQSVDLPPAGAQADKPEDDVAAPAAGDDVVPDDAVVPPADVPPVADPDADAEGVAQATEAVQTFLAVRGTDAERAVSSQGGRDELDAAIASIGRAVPQGDPACSAGADADAGTFTCVLATDQGPITFTVGPDADDPQTSGFEVIGATA